MELIFDNIRTKNDDWKIIIQNNDLNRPETVDAFQLTKIGKFTFGSNDENESSSFPGTFELEFQYVEYDRVGNQPALSWRGMLNSFELFQWTISVFRNNGTIPFFYGILDSDEVTYSYTDQTFTLKWVDWYSKNRDFDITDNPFDYELEYYYEATNNGYYPIVWLIANMLSRKAVDVNNNTGGEFVESMLPTVDSDCQLMAEFSYTLEGNTTPATYIATLTGNANWSSQPNQPIRRAYLSLWNRFYFNELHNKTDKRPKTIGTAIQLIMKNLGCRLLFLPSREIYIQQRWRNTTKIPVNIEDKSIVDLDPKVIKPKKGICSKLYMFTLDINSENQISNSKLREVLSNDVGLVVRRDNEVMNSTWVEEIPFIMKGGGFFDGDGTGGQLNYNLYFQGMNASFYALNSPDKDNPKYHIARTCNRAGFYLPDDATRKELYQVVRDKLFNLIKDPRSNFVVTVEGINWSAKDYYRINDLSNNTQVYQCRYIEYDITANTTVLDLIKIADL